MNNSRGVDIDIKKALQKESYDLSERQLLFVTAYLQGHSKTESAAYAGYSENHANAVYRSARVQAALAGLLDRFLVGELATLAMRTAYVLLSDQRVAPGVKASLALGVLDRAGFSAKKRENASASTKQASEMTRVELSEELARLSSELAAVDASMRVVSVPDSEPITQQVLDMYE